MVILRYGKQEAGVVFSCKEYAFNETLDEAMDKPNSFSVAEVFKSMLGKKTQHTHTFELVQLLWGRYCIFLEKWGQISGPKSYEWAKWVMQSVRGKPKPKSRWSDLPCLWTTHGMRPGWKKNEKEGGGQNKKLKIISDNSAKDKWRYSDDDDGAYNLSTDFKKMTTTKMEWDGE